MRFSFTALTGAVCLLAAGTVFAETPKHPMDIELCHGFVRTTQNPDAGALKAGTTFVGLVQRSGCETQDSQCVVQYCYGDGAVGQAVSDSEGRRYSER